ncbi:MAG TPA: hypothetical protein VK013_13015 [Myxococcaceae bacterium]|nr:hypothetical protein [Myxococcaceae bacterium]
MSVSGPPPSEINEATLLRGDHGVLSEPDNSNTRLVALVGAVAVVVFIIAGVWAGWLYVESRRTFAPDGLPETPSLITERSYEIGIVNQWDFKVDYRARVLTEQREAQLNAYGWVDRRQERIHAPVESVFADVIADRGVSPIAPAAPTEEAPQTDDLAPEAQPDEAPASPPEGSEE